MINVDQKKLIKRCFPSSTRGIVDSEASRCVMDLGTMEVLGADISSISKRVTTHTLRHTHISTLAQLGINLKAIQYRELVTVIIKQL